MGGIKKRHLQFIAVTLLASSLVTFVPLQGEQERSALAATTPTNLATSTIETNTINNVANPATVNTQSEKRYSVYQIKGDQSILLNSFQNLNDAILLAKGTANAKVMDEVSHSILWNNVQQADPSSQKTFVKAPKPGINANFDDGLAFVLDWEGGYSNDANDHGGSTFRGITQSEYTGYRNAKGLPDQDVRSMNDDELREIYYNSYWLAVHGNDIPYPIAIALFDSGVNCGPGTAKDFLEKSLGTTNRGWTGIKQALSRLTNKAEVALKMMDLRDQYYQNIVNHDASQGVFLQGWLNRENALTYKLNEWTLQNHFYYDEAKWFVEKKNVYNAAYYAVQAVKHDLASAKDAVSLGDGLSSSDQLSYYQNLVSSDAIADVKQEVKSRYLDLAKSSLAQKTYDQAATYAMQSFQLGATAQEVVGLADAQGHEIQNNYWYSLLHSGQDLPPAIDAEYMRRQSIPVTGITLGNKSLRLMMQDSPVHLSVFLSPVNATKLKVTWSTDNDKIVNVDANGVVTPVGIGTATITATTTDDSRKKDTCFITVVPNQNIMNKN